MTSMPLFAQNDVTRFLEIPVDGFKSDMIQKLKDKGFVEVPYREDVLTGEFNGRAVNLHVVTNNNKVYRIMLCDKNDSNETSIKIRFNTLCHQFANNSNYYSPKEQTIPDEEDISYEMTVNNKRYEAVFYQKILQVDTVAMQNKVEQQLMQKYTQEQIDSQPEEVNEYASQLSLSFILDLLSKKTVWFMISEFRGNYSIVMYYDNEYNKANGEDL